MKKFLVLTFALFIGVMSSMACDFEFSSNKKTCKPGDEFVINVKLTLIHRSCPVAANFTKFKPNGINVVSATEWKEEKPGIWTRKVKVKVPKDHKGKITLTATRNCDKDGGYGVFSLDCI